MVQRRTVNLPLHYGKAPRWLFARMKKLSAEIAELIIIKYGPAEFIKRLSHPLWFQSLGCIVGFDWHSSGLTTTLCGALKEGLKNRGLGIYICGGKGSTSRKTPEEISDCINSHSLKVSPEEYTGISRITAKIDNALIQDGYQIYHHNFIFDDNGNWSVVQQGMNPENKYARRYHWFNEDLEDFFSDPHKGIITARFHKNVLNIVARESSQARKTILEISKEDPEKIVNEWGKIVSHELPARHHIIAGQDIRKENLKKILLKTYESSPANFKDLISIRGVGPRTIRALSLISELVAGTAVSTRDPAVFSFAHGGKDGIPYPVDKETYGQSILILKEAVERMKSVSPAEKKKILGSL